ncbi:MAG: hypothetical protein Q7K03_05795 [Dehalococcoidia bacterium]|nr:hypothetical protein [Dehalococcoidia bacterium]
MIATSRHCVREYQEFDDFKLDVVKDIPHIRLDRGFGAPAARR